MSWHQEGGLLDKGATRTARERSDAPWQNDCCGQHIFTRTLVLYSRNIRIHEMAKSTSHVFDWEKGYFSIVIPSQSPIPTLTFSAEIKLLNDAIWLTIFILFAVNTQSFLCAFQQHQEWPKYSWVRGELNDWLILTVLPTIAARPCSWSIEAAPQWHRRTRSRTWNLFLRSLPCSFSFSNSPIFEKCIVYHSCADHANRNPASSRIHRERRNRNSQIMI